MSARVVCLAEGGVSVYVCQGVSAQGVSAMFAQGDVCPGGVSARRWGMCVCLPGGVCPEGVCPGGVYPSMHWAGEGVPQCMLIYTPPAPGGQDDRHL